jgi:hypothetical protein
VRGKKREVRGERDDVSEEQNGPVRFVGAVVTSAVSAGLLVISATVLGVDALRAEGSSAHPDSPFYLLVGGTLAGILLAAYAAWRLLEPIASLYRRGSLSVVSAFATVLLMLICIPVNQLLGRTGLLVLLCLSGLTAATLARRVRRWRAGR